MKIVYRFTHAPISEIGITDPEIGITDPEVLRDLTPAKFPV
jgi:hypothetical protein